MSAVPSGLTAWLEHNERNTMSTQPFVELDLESQIDWNAHLLHTAPTPEERAVAWDRLKKLHVMRSPEKVDELERARGLR